MVECRRFVGPPAVNLYRLYQFVTHGLQRQARSTEGIRSIKTAQVELKSIESMAITIFTSGLPINVHAARNQKTPCVVTAKAAKCGADVKY
ncbi:protein of unknown function [Taphrina deformans PYCC 5710]|uniref:Uncharacterized protein n=1 Tax=Taphrina deformans (strain PYCC 5710 / ATCC 11124 / CBS 356.35 / IMI 108563 / JCM 9778 / NBRC 8474) TaxID=1097556 RepID=R4XFT5_TAPDE|nr:protein of unknown function [Taphrina deformans PYCC 5710]|eukprot:CCG82229.1 protein of unknown function [Taphrina deformans PYCC 5710]